MRSSKSYSVSDGCLFVRDLAFMHINRCQLISQQQIENKRECNFCNEKEKKMKKKKHVDFDDDGHTFAIQLAFISGSTMKIVLFRANR